MFKNFIDIAKTYAVEAGVSYREAAREISILRPDFYFEGGGDFTGTISAKLKPARAYKLFVESKRQEFENDPKIRKAFPTLSVYVEAKLKSQLPNLIKEFGEKS